MIRRFLIVVCSTAMLAVAAPALAQGGGGGGRGGGGGGRQGGPATPPAPVVPLPRIGVFGMGGVTFDHAPGGVYGGGVTITTSPRVLVLVEGGYFTNILPRTSAANLDQVAASFVAGGTTPFSYTAKRPGFYGLGALRLQTPMSHTGLQPFIEGGVGFAHVNTRISASSGATDETSPFLAAIAPLPEETKPMFTAGAGLVVRAGKRSAVDLGYRYGRILTTSHVLPTHRFYAALRIGI